MKFISTRNSNTSVTIGEAIAKGLAPDGGLFVPASWPTALDESTAAITDFPRFAEKILSPFFFGDPLSKALGRICDDAFSFPVSLVRLDSTTSVLQLFQGPTAAFKDFGARFLARCLTEVPSSVKTERLVIVATSGDTGGAVAAAFAELTQISVIVLYPKGRVSSRQEKQLTTWGPRVKAFKVNGNFDDCQRIVKEALRSDRWRSRFQLISANSINVARLLPQMCYFAFASSIYKQEAGTAPTLIVPSGNLGNSVAALWAKKLGFPIAKVIFAHNQNRTVADYFVDGVWRPRPSVETLANAMDVGDPSNFERLKHLYPTREMINEVATAQSVSDNEIRQTICNGPIRWRQVWCPHTAAAVFILEQEFSKLPQRHFMVVATAHPAKFETIVEPLIGRSLQVPSRLQSVLDRPSVSQEIGSRLEDLERIMDFDTPIK